MLVSVVLCTRNRAGMLPAAVSAIERAAAFATHVEVELLIVDNGSTNETPAVLQSLASDSPLRITLLSEPRAGLCRSKNRAISHAKGDVLAFTDDDCRVAKEYFSDLQRHYAGDVEPVIRGGRVELGDPNDLPITIKVENEPATYSPPAHPGGFAHGCNLTMARAVIDRIGNFDTELGPGANFLAAEDTDMVYRAYKGGVPVLYVPDMATFHHHGRRTAEDVAKLITQYHLGNGALYAKHGLLDIVLLRHFYWNARNYLREFVGGPLFDPALKISHAALFGAQVKGALRYAFARWSR
jgi:GT2 family glycosyltransferase